MNANHSQQNKHLDDNTAAYAIVKYKASRGLMASTFVTCTEKKATQNAIEEYDRHKATTIHSGVSVLVVLAKHFDMLVNDFFAKQEAHHLPSRKLLTEVKHRVKENNSSKSQEPDSGRRDALPGGGIPVLPACWLQHRLDARLGMGSARPGPGSSRLDWAKRQSLLHEGAGLSSRDPR